MPGYSAVGTTPAGFARATPPATKTSPSATLIVRNTGSHSSTGSCVIARAVNVPLMPGRVGGPGGAHGELWLHSRDVIGGRTRASRSAGAAGGCSIVHDGAQMLWPGRSSWAWGRRSGLPLRVAQAELLHLHLEALAADLEVARPGSRCPRSLGHLGVGRGLACLTWRSSQRTCSHSTWRAVSRAR